MNTVVVTDFDVHAMWLCRHVEQYFVALEETKVHLRALGVPESLVTVSGIPIDPIFTSPRISGPCVGTRPRADRFTILVSAGGFGVGPVGPHAAGASRLSHPVRVVAVCGRNEALQDRARRDGQEACEDGRRFRSRSWGSRPRWMS